MLIGVEVDAIYDACAGNSIGVKAMTIYIRRYLRVSLGKPCPSLFCAIKLCRDAPVGSMLGFGHLDLWRRDEQDRGHRHSRLDWCCSDLMDKRRYALSCGPGIVIGVAELEVIAAEHENDQRQRRVHFNALRQSFQTVTTWFKWIVPHGTPAIQAIFEHSDLLTRGIHPILEHTRPTAGQTAISGAYRG